MTSSACGTFVIWGSVDPHLWLNGNSQPPEEIDMPLIYDYTPGLLNI